VAQENDAEERHEIFTGGQLGISLELVGGFPQTVFKLFNVPELVVIYGKLSREGFSLRSEGSCAEFYFLSLIWRALYPPLRLLDT
jgi:hypothetical protein